MSFPGAIRAFFLARGAQREMNLGRFEAARSLFAASLALSDSAQARVKMALCAWEAGERVFAIEEGARACAGLPAGNPARLFHALVLVEEGRFDEALRIVEEVRAADRGNPFAAGLCALADVKRGRTKEAAAALGRFVFGSPVFRAHLLAAIELRLLKSQQRGKWLESYLECVL